MERQRVYLAGPISGLSYGDCTDWREYVSRCLFKDMDCLSPMRAKEYLSHENVIADSYQFKSLSCDRGITTRDYNDVKRCDLVFVNFLGATKPSLGTCMEIAWAKAFQIPVVVAMEKTGNPHDHCMIRECVGFRVETVEEAIHITRATLLP